MGRKIDDLNFIVVGRMAEYVEVVPVFIESSNDLLAVTRLEATLLLQGYFNVLASEEGDLLSCLNQLHRMIYGEANPSLEPPPVLNALNFAGARSSNLI
jgi:hypothetical protein